jgi:TRAP transporter TAXI family solute receptor
MSVSSLRVIVLLVLGAIAPGATLAQEAHWPASLTIATASPGGTYFVYGEGLARILTRALNIPVAMRPTEGPADNIALLESGEVQVAFVTLGVALQAWNGTGSWDGKQARSMRAMFPMYDTPMQFMVLEQSGIQSIGGLSGKRVGIGPRGGTAAAYMPEFFKVLKVDAEFVYGEWADLADRVHAGTLDGLAVAAGIPFPSFSDLEAKAKGKVRYLPLSQAQIVGLRLAMPELGRSIVPGGTYPSLKRDYPTVGLYNFAVAHKDLPDDLVYAIVGSVFASNDEMIDVHRSAASTIPQNFTRNTFLPFHNGASRWYHNNSAVGVERGD